MRWTIMGFLVDHWGTRRCESHSLIFVCYYHLFRWFMFLKCSKQYFVLIWNYLVRLINLGIWCHLEFAFKNVLIISFHQQILFSKSLFSLIFHNSHGCCFSDLELMILGILNILVLNFPYSLLTKLLGFISQRVRLAIGVVTIINFALLEKLFGRDWFNFSSIASQIFYYLWY